MSGAIQRFVWIQNWNQIVKSGQPELAMQYIANNNAELSVERICRL